MRICPKCNMPNPNRETACCSCGASMPQVAPPPRQPRKPGRLLIGMCMMTCIGVAILTMLLMRYHILPAQALGMATGAPRVEQALPEDTDSAESDPQSESSARIPEIPRVSDPEVPTHKPDLHNPLDVLAEQSIMRHGDRESPMIALTFDDGPHPVYTRRLLEILDRYGVKATFFVVGKVAAKYPDTVRAIRDGGHVVGNHTWDHERLAKLPDTQCEAEWEKCSETLYSILGRRPLFCRPPGCNMNAKVVLAAASHSMTTVLYTVNPGDYELPGRNAILNRVLNRVKDGGIILLHDGVEETIDILPKLIETLQARGYEFVTIEEMDRANWMPREPIVREKPAEVTRPAPEESVPAHKPASERREHPRPATDETPKPESVSPPPSGEGSEMRSSGEYGAEERAGDANVEHRTSNVERRTPNVEHRTWNTQHLTPNTHRLPRAVDTSDTGTL